MVTQDRSGLVFQAKCPGAREVYLVGDFNNWSLTHTPMEQVEGDLWQTRERLPSGRYRFRYYAIEDYRYTPDAPWGHRRWLIDPTVQVVDNRVGGRDSVIEVP